MCQVAFKVVIGSHKEVMIHGPRAFFAAARVAAELRKLVRKCYRILRNFAKLMIRIKRNECFVTEPDGKTLEYDA